MEKIIQELKQLLLNNTDTTKFGDGYEKAMIEAINVCESQEQPNENSDCNKPLVSFSEAEVCDCEFIKGCSLCVIGRIKIKDCKNYIKQT